VEPAARAPGRADLRPAGVEIHQVVASAAFGDAVTEAALGLRDVLRRIGPSQIFAHHVDEALAGEVGRLADYAARPGADRGRNVLVYHASIGEPAVCSFLLHGPEKLVLVYHPVTAPDHLLDLDPPLAALLIDGGEELAALRPRVSLALAGSADHAADLQALGYDDVRVSPLPVDTGRLCALAPDRRTTAFLDEHLHGPLVLAAGDVLPHRRPNRLLSAYHVLVTYLVPDAYLAIVGPSPRPGYRDVLESFRLQLNLHRAWLPGPVGGPAARAAWLRAAAVFVTDGDGEDVAVSALEAMAFGVPVVARAADGFGDAVAGGGLVLPPGDDPVLLAEALAEVLGNDDLRRSLAAAGRRRAAAVDPDRARATFLTHLAEVV